ncbi:MAG TPA: hypothetical protein VN829_14455 [Dongiaceae bacterium]|nr:hypothetical protein [Dongiaceae bacterium]
MKLLRNPIVTGLLVLAAVVMVFYQVVMPQWQRSHPRPSVSVTALAQDLARPPAPKAAPASSPAVHAETPVLPDAGINSNYAQAHFSNWVESPRRDPFYLLGVGTQAKRKAADDAPSPVKQWRLEAIWDQTGSRLAAINQQVYGVGDEVQGYKIVSIEAGEVWFDGPRGNEGLSLDMSRPAVPPASLANQPPAPATTP